MTLRKTTSSMELLIASSTGAIILQGPHLVQVQVEVRVEVQVEVHQVAKKSTTTSLSPAAVSCRGVGSWIVAGGQKMENYLVLEIVGIFDLVHHGEELEDFCKF